MSKNSRLFLIVTCFILTASFMTSASLVSAAGYPERPITVIVPFNPGGSSDTSCRTLAKYMMKYIGRPIVVKNIAGAAGTLGSRKVLDSKPDGYTLLYHHITMLTAYHTGVADITWDSFTPICQGAKFALAIAVKGDSKWKTIKDLIKDAKAHPNTIKFGTNIGAGAHFQYADFAAATGTSFRLVPTGGDSDRITKLLGGVIDVGNPAEVNVKPYVESGRVRCLAVASNTKSVVLPQCPTLPEEGINATLAFFPGFFGPKDTPKEVVEAICAATKKAAADPGCVKDLLKIGMSPAYLDQADWKAHLQELDAKLYYLAMKLNLLKRVKGKRR